MAHWGRVPALVRKRKYRETTDWTARWHHESLFLFLLHSIFRVIMSNYNCMGICIAINDALSAMRETAIDDVTMTTHSAGHRQAPYAAAPHAICLSGWLSQFDTRYFFGVADGTEPSRGQGFRYDRLVGSIVLSEAGLENTILSAPMLEQHGTLAVPARLGASR
jgi:hypothetical protein